MEDADIPKRTQENETSGWVFEIALQGAVVMQVAFQPTIGFSRLMTCVSQRSRNRVLRS